MNKRILLVAASVALALIGAVAVYSYASNADTRAVAATKGVKVLVASSRVSAGTTWTQAVHDKSFRVETMPSDATPDSALRGISDAAVGGDAVAQSDIAPGQVVLREAFGTKVATTGVLSIPKGLIAVTVGLSAQADVAGFVAPGSQVMIMLSAKLTTASKSAATSGTTTGDDPSITRTLVARAGVLATSTATTDTVTGSKDGDASAASVLVTLALSQQDAERVVQGQNVGTLYLGLLSAGSTVSGSDPGVSNVALSLRPSPIFVK